MPTPQYTVAAEIAELFSQGLFPLPYARKRMADLGLDEEVIETMLAGAAQRSQVLTPAGRQHLESLTRACRTLLIAWDTLDPTTQEVVKPITHSIQEIKSIIGEPKE